MTATLDIFEAVDQVDQATIFYGNSDAVVTAMRETSYTTTSPYMEVSAPIVTTALLDAIKQMDALTPTFVLFNDFDSAEETMQQNILQLLESHNHDQSVMAAFIHGPPPANGNYPPAKRIYHVDSHDECTTVTPDSA